MSLCDKCSGTSLTLRCILTLRSCIATDVLNGHLVKAGERAILLNPTQAKHGCWAGVDHLPVTRKESFMATNQGGAHARIAILAMAEIKAAAEAFDRGDTNLFDALDAIVVAIEDYQAKVRLRREAA